MVELKKVSLQELAAAAVRPQSSIRLHPVFLGERRREDAWSCQQWRRVGDFLLLLLVKHGTCRLKLAHAELVCGPGDAFILAAEARPDILFSDAMTYQEVYFKISEGQSSYALASEYLHLEHALDLSRDIQGLASLSGQESGSLLQRYALAHALARCQYIIDHQQGKQRQLSLSQRNAIIDWVSQHIRHEPAPNDIAQLLQLTPDYCARLFKQSFGLSVRDWLIRERMYEAGRLLRDQQANIESVAIQLSYESTSHFSRQFKKIMNCTPSEWRSGL